MKKYESPLTAGLTPDNWQEKINPKDLSLSDVSDLIGDFQSMFTFSKKMLGYMKEIARGKMGDDMEFVGPHWELVRNFRTRAGGLNKELILDEMGEDWVIEHSKPEIEYEEMRVNRIVDEVE